MKSFVTTITSFFFLAVFITAFTACQSDRRLNVLEQAGENYVELEKVLQHYKDDAQKLKAAEFLMENMDAHYTLESPAISRFRQDVDSLYRHHPKQDVEFYEHAYDALLGQYNLNEEGTHKRYDAQELKAEYLIAHIDHAFQSWASVWNNHYDFEHFCNYVLPYRVDNEPVSDWMTYYKEKYREKLKLFANPQGAEVFNNSTLNIEIEAYYAQYLYSTRLSGYKGSYIEKRYNSSGSKNKAIKMLEDALDNKGRLKNDSCEVILQMRIDSFINIVRGSETYGTSVYKYDSTKNIVSNFNNINILSEDC